MIVLALICFRAQELIKKRREEREEQQMEVYEHTPPYNVIINYRHYNWLVIIVIHNTQP